MPFDFDMGLVWDILSALSTLLVSAYALANIIASVTPTDTDNKILLTINKWVTAFADFVARNRT